MPPKTRAKRRRCVRGDVEPQTNKDDVNEEIQTPTESGSGAQQQSEVNTQGRNEIPATSCLKRARHGPDNERQQGVIESTSESEVSDSTALEKRKKKEKVTSTMTIQEEESMVEWLRDHPEFYDKRMIDYKNVQKKESLWKDKANEFIKDVTLLKVWYKSLRTRLGRLLKTKSGQAADQELIERDRWILSNLEFLRVHIERVHRRPLVSLDQCTAPQDVTASTTEHAGVTCDNLNKEIDTQDLGDPTPPSSISSHTTATRHKVSNRGRRGDEADDAFLSSLRDQGAHLMTMQEKLLEHLKPPGDQERLGFVEFVRSTLLSLNHDCWRRCQKDMLQLLMRYIDDNESTRRSEPMSSARVPPPAHSASSSYPGTSSTSCGQHMWQPPPSQWPTQVNNRTSVWGSMDPHWLQQEFPQINLPGSSPRLWITTPSSTPETSPEAFSKILILTLYKLSITQAQQEQVMEVTLKVVV